MTVDEFIAWHEEHPMKSKYLTGFPHLPRTMLEEMVAEGYELQVRDVGNGVMAPYILSPEEAAINDST